MLLSAACRIAEGGEIRACLVVRACNDHHVLRARLVGDEREVGWVGLGFVTGRDHDDDALIGRARDGADERGAGRSTAQRKVDDLCAVLDSDVDREEEHTSDLQSLMRISYAVFCLQKTTTITISLI